MLRALWGLHPISRLSVMHFRDSNLSDTTLNRLGDFQCRVLLELDKNAACIPENSIQTLDSALAVRF
jgi:hypothetical protein